MQVGARIGPYVCERELGRGGMGAVWLARHVELGRPVALKLVLLDRGADVELLQRRFEIEAQAVAQLDHPAIVRIFAAGVAERVPWMALELVEGGTLQARLEELVMAASRCARAPL